MSMTVRQQLKYWGIAAAVFFLAHWGLGNVILLERPLNAETLAMSACPYWSAAPALISWTRLPTGLRAWA